jgi:hypothetical protein
MRYRLKKPLAILLMVSMIFAMLSSDQVALAKQKASAVINCGQVCQYVNGLLGATKKSKDMNSVTNYKKGDAYYNTMAIALNAGYLSVNSKNKLVKASTAASYDFVADIFSKLLGQSKSEILGKHKSNGSMTLKQFEKYAKAIVPDIISKDVSNKTYQTNAVINKPDVTLKDVTFKGNLIIGDGVADKEVILNNVKVTGKLIVRGGGENSIKIYGTSDISSIDIKQMNNKVSIKVSNDANVQIVYINDGCNDVTLYGPIGNVNVTGDDINVSTKGATIANVIVSGENSSFAVSEDTVVKKVSLDKSASNAQLTVVGTVTEVASDAVNSKINVDGKGNVEAITAGKAATGTEINVANAAVVKSVTSDAKETVIKGDGKVDTAVINGDESKITTKDTKVTVGEDVKGVQDKSKDSVTPTPAPTVAPTAAPSGGTGTGGIGGGTNDTPTPTVTTTPTPTPIVTPIPGADDRFATGYPQVIMGTKTGDSSNLTIKLKLKDGVASVASPVTVYYIVTTSNTSCETSAESVIHGHLGTDEVADNGTLHNLVFCNYTAAVKFTSTDEVSVPINVNYHESTGLVTYFVIKSAVKTSDVPTKIAFTSDVVSSTVDTYPPQLMSTFTSDATPVSAGTEQRTVRLIVDEVLNTATTVSGSAFTVSGVTGASITAVALHKQTGEEFSPNQNWIDLTLQYEAGASINNMEISYTNPGTDGLKDVANIPNNMENFTLYRNLPAETSDSYLIRDAEPNINRVDVSSDGKYICLTLLPKVQTEEYKYLVNDEEWTCDAFWYNSVDCRIFLHNDSALKKESSYKIEITKADGSKIHDVMDQEYDSVTDTISDPVDSTVSVESATYNMAEKKLTVTLNRDIDNSFRLNYACQYVVKVDGVSYRLRGFANEVLDNGKLSLVFDVDNLFELNLAAITTSSKLNIELTPVGTGDFKKIQATEPSGKPLGINSAVSVVEK